MLEIQETPYENMAFWYFVQGFIVVFYSNLTITNNYDVTMFSDWSCYYVCVCVCVRIIYQIKQHNLLIHSTQSQNNYNFSPPHIFYTTMVPLSQEAGSYVR